MNTESSQNAGRDLGIHRSVLDRKYAPSEIDLLQYLSGYIGAARVAGLSPKDCEHIANLIDEWCERTWVSI